MSFLVGASIRTIDLDRGKGNHERRFRHPHRSARPLDRLAVAIGDTTPVMAAIGCAHPDRERAVRQHQQRSGP